MLTDGRIGRPWTINGRVFDQAESRILRNVPRGTTEKWVLETPSGWSHPIHIHLVDFQVISRSTTNPNQAPGRRALERYEAVSLKDVVVLGQNERVEVLAKYAPWDGVYMFHCHNNVHEDHDMMAAFNVSALPNFGYPDTTILADPMDSRFRAKPYSESVDPAQIRREVLPAFARLKAYGNVTLVEEHLDAYWASRTGAVTSTRTTTKSEPTTTTNKPTTTKKPTTTQKPTTTKKPTTTSKPTTTKKPTTKTTTTKKPTSTPKPRPDGRCGKHFGDATCDSKGPFGGCCSTHGWCGKSQDHCLQSKGCQSGCTTNTTPSPSKPGATKNGRCGKGFGNVTCKGWVE